MGKDRAATMMSLLPPAGWGDVATNRDLDQLAKRLDTRIENLDAKLERLDAKIDTVAERLDASIRGLQRAFVTWLLTAQATVVASVSALLVVLH